MSLRREQASVTGGRTLEVFASTPRLTEWVYSRLAPGVRGDVLEIGSGIGTISRLIRPSATHLVVSDAETHYLHGLREAFAGDAAVEVVHYDLDRVPPPAVASRRYDAIVAVNVIEHIADDKALVARLAGLLRPGGSLILYAPACPVAFGSLDVALGHYRRYTPESLATLLRGAGLDPGELRYVNLLGLCGWLVNGRVLRRRIVPQRSVALFETLVPFVRLEDRFRLPIGLGLCTLATKLAS